MHLEHAPSAETSGGTRTKYSIAAQSEFTDRMQKKSVVAPPNAISTMLTFDMIASKNTVKLWWPNGMGPQTLYHLFIGVVLDHKQEDDKPLQTTTVWISRRIGTLLLWCDMSWAIINAGTLSDSRPFSSSFSSRISDGGLDNI